MIPELASRTAKKNNDIIMAITVFENECQNKKGQKAGRLGRIRRIMTLSH